MAEFVCRPTGAPKGEFECWPLMGTFGPTIGDPGLHLSHSKSPCNSPATNEVPLQYLPHSSTFFHLVCL